MYGRQDCGTAGHGHGAQSQETLHTLDTRIERERKREGGIDT